jgi:hypothetical protein
MSFGECAEHLRVHVLLIPTPHHSIPISLRRRAHLCRNPQRRDKLDVPSRPRQQPTLPVRRHAAFDITGLPAHVVHRKSRPVCRRIRQPPLLRVFFYVPQTAPSAAGVSGSAAAWMWCGWPQRAQIGGVIA